MRSPATAVSTHGCKMEYDPLSKDGPSAVIEGGVLRALKCVENFLGQEKSTVPRYIEVKAGDAGLHQALTKWVDRGKLDLISVMISRIMERLYRMAERLPSTLILYELEEDFFSDVKLTG